jgi:hypothetical protein
LVNWDVTKEECINVVGRDMPTLLGHEGPETVAVLKEPMGSRGTGIFFVRNAEEIHSIIDEHKKEAMSKPNFLDDLIEAKGRIPSWGKCRLTDYDYASDLVFNLQFGVFSFASRGAPLSHDRPEKVSHPKLCCGCGTMGHGRVY